MKTIRFCLHSAVVWFGILFLAAFIGGAVYAQTEGQADIDPLADEILTHVEKRYASSAFAARFTIESTL